MILAGLLPVVCLGLFAVVMRRQVEHWTEAVVLGGVVWGVVIVALTETLGAAGALTFGGLLAVWGALTAALASVAARRDWSGVREALVHPRAEPWLLGPIVLVGAVTLLVALAAAPNTFDSMTYHMSRVAHWAAAASVDNYQTAILRQLGMAPFGEYAVLHLYVLAGGDRLANLVQWLAFAGCIAGVAALARRLGAGRRGMLLASVFGATIPIGILEATGTKNDVVVAFWLIAVAWLVLVVLRPAGDESTGADRGRWIALGAAAGLAVLTKATAYLFILPLLAWLALALIRARRRGWFQHALVAAAVALVLNAAFLGRNVELYGSPLGASTENDEHAYANERIGPAPLASNVLRNLALEVATGWDPFDDLVTRGVRKAHRLLGLDPELPATTWMSLEFDAHQRWRHEDSAPNPLHLVLLLASPVVLLTLPGGGPRPALALAAAIGAGFLLFSGYLQWQPWHSRLLLPLLMLGAPLVGLAVERVRWAAAAPVTAALLALAAAPSLLRNESRELFSARNVLNTPRPVQYFANWPAMTRPYRRAVGLLERAGCRDVALVSWWNGYEYPLWALLRASGAPVRVRHVEVDNASARYAPDAKGLPEPCALVAIARHDVAARYASAHAMVPVLDDSGILLFLAPAREAE